MIWAFHRESCNNRALVVKFSEPLQLQLNQLGFVGQVRVDDLFRPEFKEFESGLREVGGFFEIGADRRDFTPSVGPNDSMEGILLRLRFFQADVTRSFIGLRQIFVSMLVGSFRSLGDAAF